MHRALSYLLLLAVAAQIRAQDGFMLHDGDRVVFYGDSITEQQLYTIDVEDYVVTRFPGLNVHFAESGWGGERVTGGTGINFLNGASTMTIDERLKQDVIPLKPTVLTIMLGMNDADMKPFNQPSFDTFRNGYAHIVETVKQATPGVRVTLMQPSAYDDVTRPPEFEGGYNAVLDRYRTFIGEFAEQNHLTVADANVLVTSALRRANAIDSQQAKQLIPDRIHPKPAMHLIIAESLLRAWNATPVVSAVQIDASAGRVIR